MKRIAGGVALAACLAAAAPAARAGDEKSETERRLDQVLAELEAQRHEISELKARLSARPPEEGGIGDAVKQYLESEEGRKVLGKSNEDLGFAKAGFGSLRVNGFLQTWYTFQRDPNDGNDPGGAGGGTAGADSLRLRRTEIRLSGSVVKDEVDWTVMFDPARATAATGETAAQTSRVLQDSILTFRNPFGVSRDVAFDVGQFKFPLGREGLQPSSKLDFIDRADGSKFFGDQRRPGATLRGTASNGAFEWWLNAHQTRGQNTTADFNDQKNLVARGVLNPFRLGEGEAAKRWGDLAVGAAWFRGFATADGIAVRRCAFEAEWRKEKLFGEKDGAFLRTEWFHGEEAGATENDRPAGARSHYFAGGYSLSPQWQVAARHDEFEQETAANLVNRTQTLGVNYFLKGYNAKVSVNYVRTHERDQQVANSSLVLQFAVSF